MGCCQSLLLCEPVGPCHGRCGSSCFQWSPCGRTLLDQRCRKKYRKVTSLSGLSVDDVLLCVAVVPYQIVNYRMLMVCELELFSPRTTESLSHSCDFINFVWIYRKKRLKFQVLQPEKIGILLVVLVKTRLNEIAAISENWDQISQIIELLTVEWTFEVFGLGMTQWDVLQALYWKPLPFSTWFLEPFWAILHQHRSSFHWHSTEVWKFAWGLNNFIMKNCLE